MTNTVNLHQRLKETIMSTPRGDRLPSEPILAKTLGVSRATLREAMRTFETQGIIHRRQGVGTFVVHPSEVIATGLEVLNSITSLSQHLNLGVQMSDFNIVRREPTEEESAVLDMRNSKHVSEVQWVMEAESRPVAYLVDVLPEDVLSTTVLEQDFNGSVLDLLLRRGDLNLTTSRTAINAVAATPEIAKAIGIQRRDVLLSFEAVLFTADGRAVDKSYSYYLPGYFNFHVVRRVGK